MAYRREERFELRYVSLKDGTEKVCYPKSKAGKDEQLRIARERGIKVISCKKLYPFNTEKNQHNFMLVANICANRMHDMFMGDAKYDGAEVDRLEALKEKADKYFGYPLPVAWVTWEDHQEMQELAMMAVMRREQTCIESGRTDLLKYC